jgi:NitT/TauT family transport system substrate-binding protein
MFIHCSARLFRPFAVLLIALVAVLTLFNPALAADKTKFRVAWTIYAGWMPWDYGDQSGIVRKWGKKYGIDIDVVQINDYVESINQYTAGAFDGCVMTNMDALTIPAVSGVDSTALIIGDFSNGNDGVVLKGQNKTLKDLQGQKVNLVELSVSHYLLARGLESAGLSEKDITVVNTSDADLVGVFTSPDVTAAVTWNPLLSEIKAMPDTVEVFNSSQIPGEIIDLMVVNTETLKKNPVLGKALVGAWYEIMGVMAKDDEAGKKARAAMGKAAGTDLAGFDAQLKTTKMFYQARDAVEFAQSPALVDTMRKVTQFSFDHGLLGQNAKSADVVGIIFPGGQTLGDPKNVKLRFDAEYMNLAATGKL